MAKLQVFTLDNLTQYDGLIKNYIDTADAKSLKTVAIDGNTLKFYRVEEPVGSTTPAYEITLPKTDISGLMAKLSGATAGNVVIANADGTVADGGVALTSIATKSEVTAVNDVATANKTAIEGINNAESGILAQAKAYADRKDEAIAAAKKAGDDAQGEIDALEEVVAGMYTNKQIDDAISAAKTESTYDDTTVKADIKANTDAISALETKVNDNETDIEDKMTAITERVSANETAIADRYTKSEVDSAISTAVANAEHLKRSIVTVLPEIADADAHTIYMVEITDGSGNQKYEEFMLINGAFEKIGDSAVDLTDYATKTEVSTAKSEAIADAKAYADGLAKNYDAAGTADEKVNELADGQVATNKANIEALQSTLGEGVEAIPSDSIAALFA